MVVVVIVVMVVVVSVSSGVLLVKVLVTQSLLVSSVALLKGDMGECTLVKPLELQLSAARSRALPPVMMGILRDSFRRRLGDDVLMDKGGGEENLRVARGDLGGSPYRSLLFWPLANRSSSDLWGGEGSGRKSHWCRLAHLACFL